MLYLIIKCSELGDQWECDTDREPICLTEDASQYGLGYEVYQVNPNNTFTLIKEYDTALEFGIALYQWNEDDEEEEKMPTVLEKWKGKGRDDISKSQVKKIKSKVGFRESIKEIMDDICCVGNHGEIIQGKWVVLGEYFDSNYSLGY